jgi:hypothetical protein
LAKEENTFINQLVSLALAKKYRLLRQKSIFKQELTEQVKQNSEKPYQN